MGIKHAISYSHLPLVPLQTKCRELSQKSVIILRLFYFVDFNIEKLLTRKAVTLSGVTICLDEQNSSGRIDTYLVIKYSNMI